jgi:phage gp36-like protein
MGFLRIKDYARNLRPEMLMQIIEQDDDLLNVIERQAVEEASSYYNNRYNTAEIFADILPYDPLMSYPKGTRIEFLSEEFDPALTYATGAVVAKDGKIWQSNTNILTPSPWDEDEWDELCAEDALFHVIAETSTAGVLPTDTNEYQAGDTRNPTILMYVIDIVLYHLHCRLNPRQVPEIRVSRYQAAIDYLKDVAEGVVTPNVPIRKDDEDKDIMNFRMGSNPRFKSDY